MQQQVFPAGPRDLFLPASPGLGGRLSWKCDPAPFLRVAELCGPSGYGPLSQSAEGLRRGDRPVPLKTSAERREWSWDLSLDLGQILGGHRLRPTREGT